MKRSCMEITVCVKEMEAICLLKDDEVDLPNYHDGLPIVPKEKLTEEEEDKLL